MGSGLTPLRSRPYPLETDTPDVAADLHALALNLDPAPVVGAGTLSERPASSVAGNRYYVQGDATSANNGIEWLDTGSGFVAIASTPQSAAAASLVTSYAGRLARATDTKQWFLDNGTTLDPVGLTPATQATSTTIKNGQLLIASPGITITLPTNALGVTCEIMAGTAVTGSGNAITVSSGSANITGGGIVAAVSSFTLGSPGARARLIGDGSNWYIFEGQQDSGWTPLTLASGAFALTGAYVPSACIRGSKVELCGTINSSISGAALMATLPSSAFYPAKLVTYSLSSPNGNLGYGSTAFENFSLVISTSTGQMTVGGPTPGGSGYICLDNLGYRLV